MTWCGGDIVFLNLPCVSWWQWHPFTIANTSATFDHPAAATPSPGAEPHFAKDSSMSSTSASSGAAAAAASGARVRYMQVHIKKYNAWTRVSGTRVRVARAYVHRACMSTAVRAWGLVGAGNDIPYSPVPFLFPFLASPLASAGSAGGSPCVLTGVSCWPQPPTALAADHYLPPFRHLPPTQSLIKQLEASGGASSLALYVSGPYHPPTLTGSNSYSRRLVNGFRRHVFIAGGIGVSQGTYSA